MRRIAFSFALLGTTAAALAGPYTEPGIPAADARIVGWATGVADLTRGRQNIANPASPLASFGAAEDAIGSPSDSFGVVSLGDRGSITLTFANPITNGAGADFAVFENAFSAGTGVFAELGFVEVSTNGVDFARFPSVSLTPTATQVAPYGIIDPSDVYNLAGKHGNGTGTPFDLSELINAPASVDVNRINYVRVIDVVGSIDPAYGSVDSLGNLINDPYATAFASGGLDLDAVGVIHATVPEPTALVAAVALAGLLARRRR